MTFDDLSRPHRPEPFRAGPPRVLVDHGEVFRVVEDRSYPGGLGADPSAALFPGDVPTRPDGMDPALDPSTSPDPSRPWFLGAAPAPDEEPTGEAARAQMAAEALPLPFLHWVRCLLDFIGEGCRLTKHGAMFAVDRRVFEREVTDPDGGFRRALWGTDPRFDLVWSVLVGHGWLVREEGWVRPTGQDLARSAGDLCSEEALETVRHLLAAALAGSGTIRGNIVSCAGVDEDVLQALLVACGPSGLLLPEHSRDGAPDLCGESRMILAGVLENPHIDVVPRDAGSGHVAPDAVTQLARVARVVAHLIDCGLLCHETVGTVEEEADPFPAEQWGPGTSRVRGPVLLRGAVALVRASTDDGSGGPVPSG